MRYKKGIFKELQEKQSDEVVNSVLEKYQKNDFGWGLKKKEYEWNELYKYKRKLFNWFVDLEDGGFIDISSKTLKRIDECCNFVTCACDAYAIFHRILQSNRCRNRFCPICNKLKSGYDTLGYSTIFKWILDSKAHQGKEYSLIFITLTVPNVSAEYLREQLDDYYVAFNRLRTYKEFKDIHYGYFSKLEITYNRRRKNFHPHLHCVLVVDKDYFKSKDYLTQKRLLELWQRATRNEKISSVNIKAVKLSDSNDLNSKTEKSFIGAILEITKYMAKSSDYLYTKKTLETFYNALYHTRTYRSGGIVREGVKKLSEGELEPYMDIDLVEYVYKYVLTCENDMAQFSNFKLLSEKEKANLRKKSFNEVIKSINEE